MGYSDFDRERFLTEDRSSSARRDEFARDRARVLHSSALRRLGAKTQVLEQGRTDFARTRLTHSLEVAQIGREMAIDLKLNPEIVDLACLAHDLGHPPFGHNGETALDAWAAQIGGFEGNAQTLRLLTRIEPKVFTDSGRSVGLNLTRASLDATCKYPWNRSESQLASESKTVKFGYYDDDADVFHWMRAGSINGAKSVEAQVMDFADDVAYSVHDLEDAIVSGYVNLAELAGAQSEAQIIEQIASWNLNRYSKDVLTGALNRLRALEYWPTSFESKPSSLGKLKNLTSSLIGRFVRAATDSSYESAGDENFTRFNSSLVIPEEIKAEIAVLKGVVAYFLMEHESRRGIYEWQRAILTELLDALLDCNGEFLDIYSTQAWNLAVSEEQQRRVIVDQVASLTDQSALDLHHKLVTLRA